MALGGGTFLTQNKILPGAYINFVSAANASAALSERGTAALPLELSWGPEGTVITVTAAELQKNSMQLFGYACTDPALQPIREVLLHAKTLHLYRLNSGGAKASNAFATAKYAGTRGNSLKTVIAASAASTTQTPLYDVSTYLGDTLVDSQTGVSAASGLKENEFVVWKSGASLAVTAGAAFTGGTDGTVSDTAWQSCLDALESYSFNALGCVSDTESVKSLLAAYVRRMRDEAGRKFQVVCHDKLADYEGVVSVKNALSLVPWVTGVVAGTAVNRSASNLPYDGELTVPADYTQAQLESALAEGSFVLHRVDGAAVVLSDRNSFISETEGKSADFSSNQTIRVLDQIANDIALLFAKKYMGKVPNDAAGRISLWNDIVKHHEQLQRIRAIEDFSGDSVTVSRGESKRAVVVTDSVLPVSAMTQLYMTVYIE